MKYEEAKKYLQEGMKVNITYVHEKTNMWTGCQGKVGTVKKTWFDSTDDRFEFQGVGSNVVEGLIRRNDCLTILTEADGVTPWVDPRETPDAASGVAPKFKVGDRVKIIGHGNSVNNIGEKGVITQITPNDCRVECGRNSLSNWERFEYLQLLPDEPREEKEDCIFHHWSPGFPHEGECIKPFQHTLKYYTGVDFGYDFTPKKEKTSLNSVFQAIKAKLSPTDRVLVKHGFLNSDGSRTGQYRDQLQEMALNKLVEAEDTADFRKELAKELKQDED